MMTKQVKIAWIGAAGAVLAAAVAALITVFGSGKNQAPPTISPQSMSSSPNHIIINSQSGSAGTGAKDSNALSAKEQTAKSPPDERSKGSSEQYPLPEGRPN
ncbi:hypothetical protein [Candidatus Methylomirabilis sp.]|uniref:hypothetical protein n=1 Tax=Candidatus Methylomirabilis sp. TaxID=2032687 RepID=UPI00307641FF